MYRSVVGALALAGGAAVAAATPLPDAVPVEIFAALPGIDSPKLSPDGRKVAAKIEIDGQQYLVVQPLFGGGQPTALAQGDVDINWWKWVNDDWLVVGVGDDINLYGYDLYAKSILGVSADMKTVSTGFSDGTRPAPSAIAAAISSGRDTITGM